MRLTGVEDAGVDPALSKRHRRSGGVVLLQDAGASCPGRWRRPHGEVIAPVPNQHSVVILGVDLEVKGQGNSFSLQVETENQQKKMNLMGFFCGF